MQIYIFRTGIWQRQLWGDTRWLFYWKYISPTSTLIVVRRPHYSHAINWNSCRASMFEYNFVHDDVELESEDDHFRGGWFYSKETNPPGYQVTPSHVSLWDLVTKSFIPTDQNLNGQKVRILDEIEGTLPQAMIIHLLAVHMNFTPYIVNSTDKDLYTNNNNRLPSLCIANIALPRVNFEVSATYDTGYPRVIYCRAWERFQTGWSVWLTPYHASTWALLLVAIGGLPFHTCKYLYLEKRRERFLKNLTFALLEEIYFLVSIFIRQPIRTVTKRHILFALGTLVMSSGYESIITGKIIAPAALYRS